MIFIITYNYNHIQSITFTKYYSCDQVKNNEMGGACGTYEAEKMCIQGIGGENLGKETMWKF
jgi:hypothetical protein